MSERRRTPLTPFASSPTVWTNAGLERGRSRYGRGMTESRAQRLAQLAGSSHELLEALGHVAYMLDDAGRIVFCNEQAER